MARNSKTITIEQLARMVQDGFVHMEKSFDQKLEERIGPLENRFTAFEDRFTDMEDKLTDMEDRLTVKIDYIIRTTSEKAVELEDITADHEIRINKIEDMLVAGI